MTPEELSALLTAAADPDTATEALTQINEKVSSMISERDAVKETIEKQKKEIKDLKVDLFMRSVHPVQAAVEEEKHEETLAEFNARMVKEVLGNADQ